MTKLGWIKFNKTQTKTDSRFSSGISFLIYSDSEMRIINLIFSVNMLVGLTVKKTSNKDFNTGYDKIWQKGPEVKHKYSKRFGASDS